MAYVRPRVCVMTAGQLSTCPRMLKAADALATRYDVRVVSTRSTPWAGDADARLVPQRMWRWTVVDYDRASAPVTYSWTGARQRGASRLAASVGADRVPHAVAIRAYSRTHSELVKAALAEPVDFIYGGTTGALAAVAEAGSRASVPFAIDLEDFHSAEHAETEGALSNHLADLVLRKVLEDATFLTTSSAPMAAAYVSIYGARPQVVHNTFPLPERSPSFQRATGPIRLYWFSQTIGPGRGLENLIRAIGRCQIPATLTLRGRSALNGSARQPGPSRSLTYVDGLRALANDVAPSLEIVLRDPADPGAMVDLCREHDIGLAIEEPDVFNHDLALSNKALTYPLAGLALLLTETAGQRALAVDVGDAVVVKSGDIDALAVGLRQWADSPARLTEAKAAAWEAARRRWHWEHEVERGRLLDAVAHVLS
jgi:hypothetical protein